MKPRFLSKKLVLPLIILAIVAGIIVLFSSTSQQKKVETGAQFFISPTDAKIIINGQELKKNKEGAVELAPGQYQADISHADFDSQKQDITVKSGELTEVLVLLNPNSQEGRDLLKKQIEQQSRENITYRLSQKTTQKIVDDNPLVSLLPVYNNEFRIDYGRPDASSNKVTVIITTDSTEQRALALDWIRSKGFDPATLIIQYRFYDQL